MRILKKYVRLRLFVSRWNWKINPPKENPFTRNVSKNISPNKNLPVRNFLLQEVREIIPFEAFLKRLRRQTGGRTTFAHRIPFSGTKKSSNLIDDYMDTGRGNDVHAISADLCSETRCLEEVLSSTGIGYRISWNASRRKERPGCVSWIINPDRRSISFFIHWPTPRFAFVARRLFESRIEYAIKESARFPSRRLTPSRSMDPFFNGLCHPWYSDPV